jgi:hypothetical protein
LVLIKAKRLSFGPAHPTVALLDHLGVGNESIKGKVDTLGTDDRGNEVLEGSDDTARGVLGFEVGMQKAVEVNAEAVHLQRSSREALLLDVAVCFDERSNVVGYTHV